MASYYNKHMVQLKLVRVALVHHCMHKVKPLRAKIVSSDLYDHLNERYIAVACSYTNYLLQGFACRKCLNKIPWCMLPEGMP